MKKIFFSVIVLFLFVVTGLSQQKNFITVSMNKIKLEFKIDEDGQPQYKVFFQTKPVIHSSSLGFVINDSLRLERNFIITSIDSSEQNQTWTPVWGEVSKIKNHYKQLIVKLKQSSSSINLNIIFRIFEDGVAFRYEFPLQKNIRFFTVNDELTEFNLAENDKAFWIPADYDSNEYPYTHSSLSDVDAWKFPIISYGTIKTNIPDKNAVQTPLMLKSPDGLYINIHEAALVNYPAMQLHVNKQTFCLSANLVPDAEGNKAYLRTPAVTPWRTIIISDRATEVLASKIILNLNEPSKIKNTSWIKPMKFVGVWWEMQTGKSTWDYTKNIDSVSSNNQLIPHGYHAATTANVKRYIDFAAANGIKGVLVEGWNTGWEEWTGIRKEENFDFVTPYPDFDVKAITAYAKQKGIQMIMHNETGASVTNYERCMDTAFRFMNKFGYVAVKTGYVGKIFPTGEHHDGQWMVKHYERVAQKAATYHIMVDMHEPVRPTGLSRTYPNWMACEAGRGNEWNAFSVGSAPNHETILPFTRLIGGPMDYTPGIFKMRYYAQNDSSRQMHTTLAKQLALYVTMYSPLQMVADIPENYETHMDAFQFIKDVPVDWDDTKILDAEPGEYITIARKEKNADNWYVGAITNEESRTKTIAFNFLSKGKKYIAIVYEDADNANWKTNPETYKIEKFTVDDASVLKLKLANGGGAAISIKLKK